MLKQIDSCLGSDAAPFLWLLQEIDQGRQGALLTVTAVHGGAPRPVGTHMAVVSGKRFEGYLSGGCVEPAIALEVEAVIAGGRDAMLRFGEGSPYFDIRFPCGGGIDVLVHVGPPPALLEDILDRMARRRPFSLAFEPQASQLVLVDTVPPTGWSGSVFHRRYLPGTRLSVAGRGPELEAVARLGAALGYDIDLATPDADTIRRLASFVDQARHLTSPADDWNMPADPWTAAVLLFHERDWEEAILARCLAGPHFYIGALGSQRAQASRRERLLASGHSRAQVDRIVGPIGIIPQARDPSTLALSVLGEIALRRREADARFDTPVMTRQSD